ncbi:MAG: ATP-dependent sacrificial sulfur transferase LarE [candidate division Zixibacteria bacterium]|nr:ATP-dependent sacrificial sulfur transferase LarE [candidate division Zixibacteria bacterium]
MTESIENKEAKLLEFIRQYKTVLVAFSGGLDSTMVLWASIKALGADNVYASTSESASFASGEGEESKKFAIEVGLKSDRHIFITTDEMDNPDYQKNPSNRCYFCKSELFTKLQTIANKYKVEVIFDGSNASDVGDYRPGRQAAEELNVASPLLEAGLSKEELRVLARKYNLSFAEKPAAACLSSRFPYGTKITFERLKQVDQAEVVLHQLGFKGFRVRYHNEVARLEFKPEDISRAMEPEIREKIILGIKSSGFKFVAVDLEGYSTGSLNRLLKIGEK